MEPDRVRPLSAFDLLRLHPIFLELDSAIRIRHVLSDGAAAASHALSLLRAFCSAGDGGVHRRSPVVLGARRAALLFDGFLSATGRRGSGERAIRGAFIECSFPSRD